jgi:hypothetical protein
VKPVARVAQLRWLGAGEAERVRVRMWLGRDAGGCCSPRREGRGGARVDLAVVCGDGRSHVGRAGGSGRTRRVSESVGADVYGEVSAIEVAGRRERGEACVPERWMT